MYAIVDKKNNTRKIIKTKEYEKMAKD